MEKKLNAYRRGKGNLILVPAVVIAVNTTKEKFHRRKFHPANRTVDKSPYHSKRAGQGFERKRPDTVATLHYPRVMSISAKWLNQWDVKWRNIPITLIIDARTGE